MMSGDANSAKDTEKDDAAEDAQAPAATLEQDLATLVKQLSRADLATLLAAQQKQDQLERQQSARRPQPPAPAKDHHKFWSTQPVVHDTAAVAADGPIEASVPVDAIPGDAGKLPKDFEWVLVDVTQDAELKELYELLSLNYVEDTEAMFRFNYSADFLRWALCSPGWKKEWHLGVRVVASRKLVAFISGIPISLRVRETAQTMVEINFLCVHKKLRAKRLAPVLIKEVTRRVNREGIFQAVYTAGAKLPTPVATCRYFHRQINTRKLVDTGFAGLPMGISIEQLEARYEIKKPKHMDKLRPLRKDDVPAACKLLNAYLAKFIFAPVFSEAEFEHWFVPIDGVVYSYVMEENGAPSAFFSLYSLPSSVIGNPLHKKIEAAYLYYYAPRDDNPAALMRCALAVAKEKGFDVLNCLDMLDNREFLDDLRFGKGDGFLNYYLFNYAVAGAPVKCEDVGLVML